MFHMHTAGRTTPVTNIHKLLGYKTFIDRKIINGLNGASFEMRLLELGHAY